jgi:hypothetical protein
MGRSLNSMLNFSWLITQQIVFFFFAYDFTFFIIAALVVAKLIKVKWEILGFYLCLKWM